jgi:hypothetical protein
MTPAFILGSTVKPCLTFSEILCDFNEYAKFYAQDVKKLCSDECPLECEQQTFTHQVSSLAYPTHPYYNYLMQQPDVVSKFGLNASEITYDKMRNSILRLNIYYETLSFTKIEETIKVQLFDLISGIGGIMVTFC